MTSKRAFSSIAVAGTASARRFEDARRRNPDATTAGTAKQCGTQAGEFP